MASNAFNGPEIEDPPITNRSGVWVHFGFPVSYDGDGKRVVDKKTTVCRICYMTIGHTNGNTSNMSTHLRRHHPSVSVSGTRRKQAETYMTQSIPAAFRQAFPTDSNRAKQITAAIGTFIAADMRPYSVVENAGFKNMLNVIEPRYTIPSRAHFSQTVIPDLYQKTKAQIENQLAKATAVALTTDGWTSRATQSYLTVTAHYITAEWELKSHVLQTRPLDSHTSEDLAKGITEAVEVWKLERANLTIPVTTDNARNIVNAVVGAAGLGPQIGCFAHVINLASQKAMAVQQISRLLAKIRKIVTFFHRSTTAAHVLKTKQELLQLPVHKLIQDIPTRWNSSYDMIERYIEQQAAVYSAMTDKAVKKNVKDIMTLSENDMRLAENVITVLKPLKTVTTLMCTESSPSASMVLPMKMMILKSMELSDDDSPAVRDVKTAIKNDLQQRYTLPDLQDYLHKSTALDPRFKSLQHLDATTRLRVYEALTTEIVTEQATSTTEPATSIETVDLEPSTSPPREKKSAMTELFGGMFMTHHHDSSPKSVAKLAEEEMKLYMVDSIPLDADPLKWWKNHEHLYPHFARLAQRYLAVPGTSVPSERYAAKKIP
ncbi:E3 SUMO-protein ligase ZBED1-like [Rhinichthys klamathensis goyatoka]|uniref:E3 SUMO-protein ligase ZBED1-like n=1 Tax=Rhinichthys klamathensis goyatoka TaxID=3034132 RepID=UPI0024B5255E|nr:E3 SUMO-protein ligase ZBED1-like [Rhinichthys klamathensis goyatoka]